MALCAGLMRSKISRMAYSSDVLPHACHYIGFIVQYILNVRWRRDGKHEQLNGGYDKADCPENVLFVIQSPFCPLCFRHSFSEILKLHCQNSDVLELVDCMSQAQ